MLTTGVVLLILGFFLGIQILWTLGAILAVVGAVLLVLGSLGRPVGGRRYYKPSYRPGATRTNETAPGNADR